MIFGFTYLEVFSTTLAVIALYMTWRSRRESRLKQLLRYAIKTSRVFTPNELTRTNNVACHLDGKPLDNVSYFKIIVFNHGVAAIHPTDLAGDKIIITHAPQKGISENTKIIASSISVEDSSKSKCISDVKNGICEVTFDHLSPRQAFVVEGLITGPSEHLIFEAHLKSYGKAKRLSLHDVENSIGEARFMALLTSILTAGLWVYLLAAIFQQRAEHPLPFMILSIFCIVTSIGAVSNVRSWYLVRTIRHNNAPSISEFKRDTHD